MELGCGQSSKSSGHKDVDGDFLFLSALHSANKRNAYAVFFCVLGGTKPLQILAISSQLVGDLKRSAGSTVTAFLGFFVKGWKSSMSEAPAISETPRLQHLHRLAMQLS